MPKDLAIALSSIELIIIAIIEVAIVIISIGSRPKVAPTDLEIMFEIIRDLFKLHYLVHLWCSFNMGSSDASFAIELHSTL